MKYIHFFFCLLLGMAVQAQIKIGDNPQNIDPSSVLELESSSRVLVITRVNTAQMNAITPAAGAMVYNTDVQCIHYYTGTEWKDICDAVAGSITFTSDDGTVVITSTGGNNYDLKVGQITGMNIVNETVFGADIATATIGERQLAPNSVGTSELQDNTVGKDEIQEAAVGTLEIIDGTIKPEDIEPGAFDQLLTTDAGGNVVWLNKNELGATQADQTTITGAGTSADPIKVADTVIGDILANANSITVNANNITQNSNDIAAINTALGTKEDLANKSDDTALGNSTTLYPTQNAVKTYVDGQLGTISTDDDITAVTYSGTTLTVTEGTTSFSADLSTLEESAAISAVQADVDANEAATNAALLLKEDLSNKDSNVLLGTSNTLYPTQNAVKTYVDNVVGGSAQTIVSTDAQNSITSGTDGGAFYNDGDGDDTNELTNIGFNTTTNILSLSNPATVVGGTVDLSSLAGAGADGVISLVELNGTDLDFTASGGGFNGTLDLSTIDTTLDEIAVDAFVANNGYLTAEVDGSTTNEVITASTLTGTTLTITEGGNNFDIDLSGLGGGSQDLASVLTNGSSAGNSQINDLLDPTLPQDAATQNYVETRISTILASGGVDGVVSNAFLSGTEIDFVGTNGGFNGTVDLDPVFTTDMELTSALALKEDAANKSTDVNLADATNTLFPTELAVKTYVDTQIATVSDDDITAVSFDGTDLTVTEGATSFSADISALDDSVAIATVQADVDANETAANNAIALKEDTANKSTDVNLADATNTLFPTELAVKTYVDTQIATVSDDDITAVSFDGTDLTVTEGATSFSADISALDDSVAIATVQADVDANETAANNAIALKEDTANKSTNVNLGNSDVLFPTQNAVKTYVDTEIASAAADDDITAVTFDGTNLTVTEGATSFFADISALDDSAAVALKEDTANKSTNVNLGNSDVLFPTQNAVKTYVDTEIASAAADDDITAVTFDGTNLTVTEGATSFFADISALDDSAAVALKEDTANKSTNANLGNSDVLFPTQNAVKTYVDTEIASVSGGENLENTNLVQTDLIRTYELPTVNHNLVFTGLGNIGIGNSANPPTNKFHVAGAIRSEGILNSPGDESEPSYRFNGDPNTGMFSDVADEIGFSAGGLEILRLQESVGNGLEIIATGSLELNNELRDINNNAGTPGQILSSTGTGVDWIDPPTASGTGSISSGTLDVTGGTNAAFTNVTIDIANDAITSDMISNNAIIADKIETGAVTSMKIANGTIIAEDISNNTITTDQILDESLTNADISGTAAIDGSKINPVFTANVSTTGNLQVDGNVNVTGTHSPVPDYVFQKYFLGNSDLKDSYDFQTLAQIEAFVKKHHHLPGIQSSAEIKAQGFWDLGQASKLNLEKIEELFLHTIEQEKKIDQLKNENESLSAELQSLRKDMEEIKALLKNKD
ncbi:bZIP transcription factor [Arenibacter troitsensis]|uniref:Uncharacterized protein n=1 Tax=Arenibacter troitsensis TaxID=188872 RepID=A0A1X7K7E9_9FLAO|nr:bZIP transcription factor [Arenibacter troitsensis]SMG36742.1 hypothetical protein SAMN03080602_02541 [Arenibacter troitsensis]